MAFSVFSWQLAGERAGFHISLPRVAQSLKLELLVLLPMFALGLRGRTARVSYVP